MPTKTADDCVYDIEITDADVAEYLERGYWISPKLLSDGRIESLRQAELRIWAGDFDTDAMPEYPAAVRPTYEHDEMRQCCNAWWLSAEIKKVVTDPTLGKIGGRLMKVPAVRLWHDQVLYKPPLGPEGRSDRGNLGWHQDYGFWQCVNTSNMVTAWIALQDTDLSNGGMRTAVGSHRWGLIKDSNTAFERDLDALRERFTQDGREWIDQPCVLKAGQASFHHALCFHGSGPNQTDDPRLCLVVHMMPEDCTYRGPHQHHTNLIAMGPNQRVGQKFDLPHFPVLWRES